MEEATETRKAQGAVEPRPRFLREAPGYAPIDFRECPRCYGYGIKDSGAGCRFCGGSGEAMYDQQTGARITPAQFMKRIKR